MQYWSDVLSAHGPRETVAFNREMSKLYANPRYWHMAVTAASPEVAQQGRWLRQQGLGPQSQPVVQPAQPTPLSRRPLAMPSMSMRRSA